MFEKKNNFKREKVAIALGAFDGVHIGHQHIINQLIFEANKLNLSSAVYTFNNVPKSKKAEKKPIQILKARDKYKLLKSMGVDIVYMHDFDEDLMATTREKFLENLLQYFDIKLIIVGKDFRFGYKAMGNVDWLCEQKEKYGFDLIVSNFLELAGEKVSSTNIRKQLKLGNMEEVKRMLGRNHFVKGVVIDGRKMGRKMGFPTANVQVYPEMTIISNGVYYTKACVRSKTYESVTNVGNVPSFSGAAFSVEPHILDFNENIYGEEIRLEFIKKLRDEKKFDSADELKKQIQKDVDMVRKLSERGEL